MAFCRDANAGSTAAMLSQVYGRKPATVYNWLKRLGIKKTDAPGSPEATNSERKPVSSTELTSKEEENG